MPWALVVVMALYGFSNLVFAVVPPPGVLRSWFPVPSIFVFLPDRFIVPVGRVFVGLCGLAVAGFLALQFHAVR